MRILVTGGHGFIGSHVLRYLVARGADVACLDLSGPSPVAGPVADDVHFVRGDVTDPVDVYDAIAGFEPDRIIHLASLLGRESQRRPRNAISVNLLGTAHVLEAANSLGVERVVAASSAAAYGDFPPDMDRFDEESVQRPSSIYGLTKYAVERIGATYEDQRDVEFAAIQPTHGLGPDRLRGNVEDAFILKAAVSGTPITVPNVEYPIEIIYVEDEARAFVMAALADAVPHDTYLIGSGEQATLTDVVEMVREEVPDAELELSDDRGDDQLLRRPVSDTTRIRNDLGWEPRYSIREAIAEYASWLREHPDDWSFDIADVPWST